MKLGNRKRRRREYLLDVKVQTPGRWRQRTRVGATVFAAVAMLVLASYGLYRGCGFAVRRLVFENPRFAIAQIVVDNDGALTPERVAQLGGVRVGLNLFSLDLAAVQRNLEAIPLVRRVEVRRMLPARLFIRVNERVPMARLRGAGNDTPETGLLIDRSGMVMQPLKLADGAVVQPPTARSVPVLTGVPMAGVRVGKQIESEPVYRALELLEAAGQSMTGSLLDIEQIDLSKPRTLVVTTRSRAVIRFDVESFPQQWRRLGVILSWARQRQKLVQSVDLTVNRSVPVAFAN